MATKPGGLQKRILSALQCLIERDAEEAFLHLAPAIDATSKRHFLNTPSQRKRYTQWLDRHQVDMFHIANRGRLILHGGFGKPGSDAVERIADALYTARNAAAHDPDELGERFVFLLEERYGYLKDRFIITQGMIVALVLLVLSDPVNVVSFNREELKNRWINHAGVTIKLADCIGNRSKLMRMFEHVGFKPL